MVLNKIFGAFLFSLGGFLAFGLWHTDEADYMMFTIKVTGATLSIYLGLLLMEYL